MKPSQRFSLYKLALISRQAVIGFLVLAVAVIGIDVLAKALNRVREPFLPTVTQWQELPSNSFGKLALPTITSLTIGEDSRPSFGIRGEFPLFPDTALVYQITKPREKLDAADKAKTVAERLGFNPDNVQTEASLLKWQSDRQTRAFSFDLLNNIWQLETVSYFQDANALQPKTTKKDNDYGALFSGLVGQLGLGRSSLTNGKTTYELVKRRAERFAELEFNDNPEYAVVNLYRKLLMSQVKTGNEVKDKNGQRVEKYEAYVYTDSPFRGSVSGVIADNATDTAKELYELKFIDYDYTSVNSYYYLITPTQAWQNIQDNKGVLVSLLPQSRSKYQEYQKVSVRSFTALAEQTELVYYEPDKWSGYTHPIYVFYGNALLANGETATFVFYVDALRP